MQSFNLIAACGSVCRKPQFFNSIHIFNFTNMRICIILFTLLSFDAYSIDTIGHNRFNIMLCQQYYYNTLNVTNDNSEPNPIIARNTTGMYLGIEYERTTRYGLIFGVGLQYGIKKHDILLYRDLSNFDIEANIANWTYSNDINIRLTYYAPRFFVGYHLQINKKSAAIIKVGISQRKYLGEGYYDAASVHTSYYTKTGEQRSANTILWSTKFGNERDSGPGFFKIGTVQNIYDVYLGYEHRLNFRHLKCVSIGLEATCMNKVPHNDNYVVTRASEKRDQKDLKELTYDAYLDRNISIGLRLAVGLWK